MLQSCFVGIVHMHIHQVGGPWSVARVANLKVGGAQKVGYLRSETKRV